MEFYPGMIGQVAAWLKIIRFLLAKET